MDEPNKLLTEEESLIKARRLARLNSAIAELRQAMDISPGDPKIGALCLEIKELHQQLEISSRTNPENSLLNKVDDKTKFIQGVNTETSKSLAELENTTKKVENHIESVTAQQLKKELIQNELLIITKQNTLANQQNSPTIKQSPAPNFASLVEKMDIPELPKPPKLLPIISNNKNSYAQDPKFLSRTGNTTSLNSGVGAGEYLKVPTSEEEDEEPTKFLLFGTLVKEWWNGMNGKQKAGFIGEAVGGISDGIQEALIDSTEYAADDFKNSNLRSNIDAAASSLMMFSPIGTAIGGAIKGVMTVSDLAGKRAQDFSVDKDTMAQVGGSYVGSAANIEDAANKAGKKYSLFGNKARKLADKLINEARRLQTVMGRIANDSRDMQENSTIMSLVNNFNYQQLMNGGLDPLYLRAAKSGAKLTYFEKPVERIVFEVKLTDIPTLFKKGGTILDKLDKAEIFEVKLTDPILESYKQGGAIKDREIEVIETNTTLKSVIPEGALHKNKHHLKDVGVDDSELTKKGIPVVDNDGDLQAEIELNEIIFTLEVTKELEKRYKEFYEEGTSSSRKDELAIEAGKLLWKEILYNTDDRTGLIDTLKQGGTILKDPRKPNYKEWVKDVNPDFINDNYDLETAYKYLPYELLLRWKMAVNSENPDYYLNYLDPKTGEYIYHLGSIAPYGDGDYIFLKRGKEKDNPELHWETDTYYNGTNGLKETHDLVYDKKSERYFYIKKKSNLKHLSGGIITQKDIDKMVKLALLNILNN